MTVFLARGLFAAPIRLDFLAIVLGCLRFRLALTKPLKCNLAIEDADALFGRPMGIPKTGVFGLYDLIGIDLMADVVVSLGNILPADDAFHAVGAANPAIAAMIAAGFTGDKGNGRLLLSGWHQTHGAAICRL